MERRSFLVTSVGLLSPTVAGCLSGGQTPEGIDVETRHWAADILEKGIWYQRQEHEASVGRYYELIESEAAAQSRINGDDAVLEFVEETDFTKSYLVVVQNMMQSARWLKLRKIERMACGLDIRVRTASPDEPYEDDAVVHSLAIQITDERAGNPDNLRVTIDAESAVS